jgi:hypothetical protein
MRKYVKYQDEFISAKESKTDSFADMNSLVRDNKTIVAPNSACIFLIEEMRYYVY